MGWESSSDQRTAAGGERGGQRRGLNSGIPRSSAAFCRLRWRPHRVHSARLSWSAPPWKNTFGTVGLRGRREIIVMSECLPSLGLNAPFCPRITRSVPPLRLWLVFHFRHPCVTLTGRRLSKAPLARVSLPVHLPRAPFILPQPSLSSLPRRAVPPPLLLGQPNGPWVPRDGVLAAQDHRQTVKNSGNFQVRFSRCPGLQKCKNEILFYSEEKGMPMHDIHIHFPVQTRSLFVSSGKGQFRE